MCRLFLKMFFFETSYFKDYNTHFFPEFRIYKFCACFCSFNVIDLEKFLHATINQYSYFSSFAHQYSPHCNNAVKQRSQYEFKKPRLTLTVLPSTRGKQIYIVRVPMKVYIWIYKKSFIVRNFAITLWRINIQSVKIKTQRNRKQKNKC